MDLNQFIDLKLTNRQFDIQTSDRAYVDLGISAGGDLATDTGRRNLAQAIINRLLTRQGELARLGHPNYGSRLYELIGELNNLRLRAKAEVFLRACLDQEKRIESIRFMEFEPPERGIDRSVLKVTIGIKPIGNETEFSLFLPIQI